MAKNLGIRRFEIGNVAGLQVLRDVGFHLDQLDISSDFSVYALNHEASAFLAEQGVQTACLSVEDDLSNVEAHLARGVITQSNAGNPLQGYAVVYCRSLLVNGLT